MPLQLQDLSQELDVATSERQDAKPRAQIFCAAVMPLEQTKRDQQRAEKERVPEPFGLALERPAISVDCRERLPESRCDAARYLGGDRSQQPRFDEYTERRLSRAGAHHLVDLFHQPRRSASREL